MRKKRYGFWQILEFIVAAPFKIGLSLLAASSIFFVGTAFLVAFGVPYGLSLVVCFLFSLAILALMLRREFGPESDVILVRRYPGRRC